MGDNDAHHVLSVAPNAAPTNVAAVSISSTEIMVSWDEVPPIDRNGIVTVYEVLYEPLETFGGAIMSMTVNTTNTSTTLSGLEEFVMYNISVRAYTSEGPGPYSEEIARRTDEDGNLDILVVCCGINFHSIYLTAPSAAPEAVLAVNISSTEIMVSWDEVPPIHQNGIITMYEVHYEPVEMFDGVLTNLSMLTNGPNMTIVLDGLAENVIYRISVRAFTSDGAGPYSEPVVEQTEEHGESLVRHFYFYMIVTFLDLCS